MAANEKDNKGFLRGAFLAGTIAASPMAAANIPDPNAFLADTHKNENIVAPSFYGSQSYTASLEQSNQNIGRIYEGTRKNFVGKLVGEYDLTDAEEKAEFQNKVNGIVRESQVAKGAGKLRLDLNENTGVVITDPNGISQSGFVVTNTEQEHVLRIYRGGSVAKGPGDIGKKVLEYDLNDPAQRKLAEDAIRVAQYEDNKHNAEHDAHDAEDNAPVQRQQPVPPTASQPPQAAVTQPLKPQTPPPAMQPVARQDDELFKANVAPKPVVQSQAQTLRSQSGDQLVPEKWVQNEQAADKAQKQRELQAEMAAENAAAKPVVPPAPQTQAQENLNRERARTMTADSRQYASDAPVMGVTARQQNPVAAAMADLTGSVGMTSFAHGYKNDSNNNYGSLTLRKEEGGIVSAYLGTGNIAHNKPIGQYNLNDPSSRNELERDMGIFAQNDAAWNTQYASRPTYQHNNAASYNGYYSQQQQPNGTYIPDQRGNEYRGGYQGNGMYVPPPQGNYYGGSGYNNPRMNDPNYQMQMEQRQRMMDWQMQRQQQNDYYRNANQAYGFNRRVQRDGEYDVNRAVREMDRDFNQIGRGMDGMANGRGGLSSVFGMVAPILNIGNRIGDVVPSIGGVSDPRPRASYPQQMQYPDQQQYNGYPSMYPPNNGGGWNFR